MCDMKYFVNLIKDFCKKGFDTMPILIRVYFPVFLLLLLLELIHRKFDIEVGDFTRDPAQVLDGKFYVGIISNVGLLFWMATLSITIFTAVILMKNQKIDKRQYRFLFYSSLLTFFLLTDDLLLLHDHVFPVLLGLPEMLIYALYITFIISFAVYFYKTLLASNFFLFVLAGFFMGLSIGIDIIGDFIIVPAHFLFEDGFKFCGIIAWFLYFSGYSYNSISVLFKE